MPKIDLHELVNLPYGEANKRLEEAGHYRDADIKEYTVKVTGYYEPERYTETVTVQAVNEDHAFERAEKLMDFDRIVAFEIVEGEDE